jgi:hypothetical protein
VHGLTDGDIRVESNEWLWPVRLLDKSPQAGDGECLSLELCPSLGGIDDYSQACLCDDGCEF